MPAVVATSPILLRSLEAARRRSDELFALLRSDSFYERPIPERHRIIFYLGHLETFDWNKICCGALSMRSFHPEFDRLFEAGIDPEPGQLPADKPSDWPSVKEVMRYRQRVRATIDGVLAEAPDEIVRMVIEHRFMHAETFAYILHNLRYEFKFPGSGGSSAGVAEPQPIGSGFGEFIHIPAGRATLGLNRGEAFAWDNEFQQHEVSVPSFSIGKYKITNGEYLDFVSAGGEVPHYWTDRGGQWFYRGMFREIALPLDWPVYVTQQQASAYAKWQGKSLPSEAQYHRAAFGTPDGSERDFPWGACEPDATRGNFDFHHWDPLPVDATPDGDSAFGGSQLCGNGWDWTSTVFAPFPGFEAVPAYPGYSANFFDGEHFVLKGASSRTAACFLRRSFRNWFRKEYPYTYASFRCVEN